MPPVAKKPRLDRKKSSDPKIIELNKKFGIEEDELDEKEIRVYELNKASPVYQKIVTSVEKTLEADDNFELKVVDVIELSYADDKVLTGKPLMYLFHGTKDENIKSICLNKLSVNYAGIGCFGKGVYLSPFAAESQMFSGAGPARPTSGDTFHLLLYQVEVGRVLNRWMRDRTRTKLPENYDTLKVQGDVTQEKEEEDEKGEIWNLSPPVENPKAYKNLKPYLHYYSGYVKYCDNGFNLKYLLTVKKI